MDGPDRVMTSAGTGSEVICVSLCRTVVRTEGVFQRRADRQRGQPALQLRKMIRSRRGIGRELRTTHTILHVKEFELKCHAVGCLREAPASLRHQFVESSICQRRRTCPGAEADHTTSLGPGTSRSAPALPQSFIVFLKYFNIRSGLNRPPSRAGRRLDDDGSRRADRGISAASIDAMEHVVDRPDAARHARLSSGLTTEPG